LERFQKNVISAALLKLLGLLEAQRPESFCVPKVFEILEAVLFDTVPHIWRKLRC
jgi:hypothetical protein